MLKAENDWLHKLAPGHNLQPTGHLYYCEDDLLTLTSMGRSMLPQ